MSMIEPFLDAGIDVNGGFGGSSNLLGNAAAMGNMDVVYMLLDVGADGFLAFYHFLDRSRHLSDALFERLLELLAENSRPDPSMEDCPDALLQIIQSERALSVHLEAPKILLNRKIFSHRSMGNATGTVKSWGGLSYMYEAISRHLPAVIDLLLQHEAPADGQMCHSFKFGDEPGGLHTWVTFSVMRGAANCTDVLIQHGADITVLDGTGSSAIQLARSNRAASHPRIFQTKPHQLFFDSFSITAEEDAETLAVVERAFNLKFKGTKNIEDFLMTNNELECGTPGLQDSTTPLLQRYFDKTLRFLFTPSQIKFLRRHLRPYYLDLREIWSLSFYETLLIDFSTSSLTH